MEERDLEDGDAVRADGEVPRVEVAERKEPRVEQHGHRVAQAEDDCDPPDGGRNGADAGAQARRRPLGGLELLNGPAWVVLRTDLGRGWSRPGSRPGPAPRQTRPPGAGPGGRHLHVDNFTAAVLAILLAVARRRRVRTGGGEARAAQPLGAAPAGAGEHRDDRHDGEEDEREPHRYAPAQDSAARLLGSRKGEVVGVGRVAAGGGGGVVLAEAARIIPARLVAPVPVVRRRQPRAVPLAPLSLIGGRGGRARRPTGTRLVDRFARRAARPAALIAVHSHPNRHIERPGGDLLRQELLEHGVLALGRDARQPSPVIRLAAELLAACVRHE